MSQKKTTQSPDVRAPSLRLVLAACTGVAWLLSGLTRAEEPEPAQYPSVSRLVSVERRTPAQYHAASRLVSVERRTPAEYHSVSRLVSVLYLGPVQLEDGVAKTVTLTPAAPQELFRIAVPPGGTVVIDLSDLDPEHCWGFAHRGGGNDPNRRIHKRSRIWR